jgi:hypothetical protein
VRWDVTYLLDNTGALHLKCRFDGSAFSSYPFAVQGPHQQHSPAPTSAPAATNGRHNGYYNSNSNGNTNTSNTSNSNNSPTHIHVAPAILLPSFARVGLQLQVRLG